MFEVWYCPNEKCSHKGRLKEGESCPKCGSTSKGFGIIDAGNLLYKKEGRNEDGTRMNDEKDYSTQNALYTESTSDQEIKQQIYRDMENLARQEKGTGVLKALALFTGTNAEALMVLALKAMIDQNKTLIRQNELIIRNIQRLACEPPKKEA
jgi:hypothetical protein